jgi:hypothetical protein
MNEQIEWESNLCDLMNPYYNETSTRTEDFYQYNSPVSQLQFSSEIGALRNDLIDFKNDVRNEFASLNSLVLQLLARPTTNSIQVVEEEMEIEEIQPVWPLPLLRSPIEEGFAVPSANTVAKIMNQWENGGQHFQPLKYWCRYDVSTFRSVNDVYYRKKTIAERFLEFDSISSFNAAYPDQKSMVRLAAAIKAA